MTSACTTFTLSKSLSVSASTAGSRLSNSMATTLLALAANSLVSTPKPGPTSITPLVWSAPHSVAILGHISGLIKKFCPNAFEN